MEEELVHKSPKWQMSLELFTAVHKEFLLIYAGQDLDVKRH